MWPALTDIPAQFLMMKHLLQLKKDYERTLSALPPISVPDPPESLLDQLLALVLEEKVTTDDEAAAALYGPDKDQSYKPYQKLKNKFKLYFPYKICRLPLPEATIANEAKFTCRVFLLHAKQCKHGGGVRAAEWLLLAAFRLAEEIEQYSVLRDVAFELCDLYTTAIPNSISRDIYYNAFTKYAELEDIYSSLNLSTSKLQKIFNVRKRRVTSYDLQALEMEQEVLSLIDYELVRFHSRLFLYYHKLLTDIAMLRADFETMKNRALYALGEADNLVYQSEVIKKFFIEILTIVYCKLGQYEETLNIIDYREKTFAPDSILTPYVYRYYQIIAYLQLNDYRKAIETSSTINVEEVRKFFSEEQATTYYILFAYQHILFRLGKTSETETPRYIKEFRYSRFRNRVQVQERNKQGYNVHLLIIELFYLVLQRQFDTFIDRIEGIQKYVQRYLLNDENTRNALFIRMLLAAADYDFNPDALQEQELATFQVLSGLSNIAFDRDPASNEFLPFEAQWKLFLEALDPQVRVA